MREPWTAYVNLRVIRFWLHKRARTFKDLGEEKSTKEREELRPVKEDDNQENEMF